MPHVFATHFWLNTASVMSRVIALYRHSRTEAFTKTGKWCQHAPGLKS